MKKLAKKWSDRRLRKTLQRHRDYDARALAEQAIRCLRLSDPQKLTPRTMRDWLT